MNTNFGFALPKQSVIQAEFVFEFVFNRLTWITELQKSQNSTEIFAVFSVEQNPEIFFGALEIFQKPLPRFAVLSRHFVEERFLKSFKMAAQSKMMA
jgi:hypothetical protein